MASEARKLCESQVPIPAGPGFARGVERSVPPPPKPRGVLWVVETVGVICDTPLRWSGIVRDSNQRAPLWESFHGRYRTIPTRATATVGAVAVLTQSPERRWDARGVGDKWGCSEKRDLVLFSLQLHLPRAAQVPTYSTSHRNLLFEQPGRLTPMLAL